MTPIVLDLPTMPPSVNAIWRSKRGRNGKPQFYLDARYKRWKLESDGTFMVMHAGKGWPLPITVPVRVELHFNYHMVRKHSDLDNRQKVVLDFLQRAGVLKNDSQVRSLESNWGENMPCACRIRVEAMQ